MKRSESLGQGQRFFLALLFSDLCDYTALTEASDPEDIGWLKQEIAGCAKKAIGERGGAINQIYGDGVLAVFGYPVPDEDDARRAVDAAVDLHERIRALRVEVPLPPGFRLRMHSGVHTGVVFVREGDPLHGRYELTGDVVNTTQRLCAAARPDEIVVSRQTLLGIEHHFETEDMAPLSLKGKERPMFASRVRGRAAPQTPFDAKSRRGLTPFVGRQGELERLQNSMEEAVRSGGRVVCVTGPAGIGKSRLLDAFRRRLPPTIAVFSGSCEKFANVAPLRPFAQLLRESFLGGESLPGDASVERLRTRLEGIDASLVVHLRAFLHLLSLELFADRAPGASSPTPKTTPDIGLALAALFVVIAARQPVAILLDDWHWADDASKQALGVLLRAIAQAPVLVVIGSRAIEPDDFRLRESAGWPLEPFTPDESTRAIRALLPRALDLGVSSAIHRRSGGNPLFLEELCRSIGTDAGAENLDAAIPTTVHGLIQARVARLPAGEVDVLRAAAVVGNEAPLWLLERTVAQAPLRGLLESLVEHDLLVAAGTDGAFHFQHGITREVVYESIPLQVRRALHGEVARAIEDRFRENLADQYEALAHHYVRSASHERATDFAELAGDKALAASALDRVRLQYGAALAAIDALPPTTERRKRWLKVSAKWALGCVYSPARSQVDLMRRAEEYAREVGDDEALAHTQYWMGWIHYALGDQERAIEYDAEALARAAGGGFSHLGAQLVLNLGQSHAAAGEYAEALRYLDEGIGVNRARSGRASRRGLAVGFAYALGCRALVHGDRGDFRRAYDDMNEALAMVHGAGHAIEGSLLGLLGMIQLWQGEWNACIETAQRARVTAEQVNGPYVLAMSKTVGGYARWMLERSPEGLAELFRSVEWLEARDIRLFLSFNYAHLADALVTAGQVEEAREFARRAIRRASEKDPIGEATAYRALARQAALGTAAEHEEQALLAKARAAGAARGSRRDQALTELFAGERLLASGDRAAGKASVRIAGAAFEAMEMRWYRARADELLAGE